VELARRPSGSFWPEAAALAVKRLGEGAVPSPLRARHQLFVADDERVLLDAEVKGLAPFAARGEPPPSFERAGPRERLFFDPARMSCGVLTCGGLCPGLNNVVRSVVLQLHYAYGVRRIVGFRYGYAGLSPRHGHEPLALTPELVESLHEHGGTVLGSSRGPQDVGQMVDTLVARGIDALVVIGGDGGLRGASALAGEIRRRGLRIAVVGVPKTIDNDLEWTWRSFGFDTAVTEASKVILAAHAEARGAWNGVGLVKLMGRHSGFIAANASLAGSDVNFCLVPEVPFTLEGEGGFLGALERRLAAKHHAVVVVAEGAGQELCAAGPSVERDASGNVKLRDIGVFLRDRIAAYLADRGIETGVRYIDPSYTIRSQPANAHDAQLCLVLGQYAVHAVMAGRTDVVVGLWNQHPVHVPIPLAVGTRRQIDPDSDYWRHVLEATGQPAMVGRTAAG
jgi:6-phosphofructokinase 1